MNFDTRKNVVTPCYFEKFILRIIYWLPNRSLLYVHFVALRDSSPYPPPTSIRSAAREIVPLYFSVCYRSIRNHSYRNKNYDILLSTVARFSYEIHATEISYVTQTILHRVTRCNLNINISSISMVKCHGGYHFSFVRFKSMFLCEQACSVTRPRVKHLRGETVLIF